MTPFRPAPEEVGTPGLARRLICLVYEGVVLFGIVMMAGFAYGTLTSQRHALIGMTGLQLVLAGVLGLYFVWFWTHGGQTVAMKTWRLRVVSADMGPLTLKRATARYVLGWLWILPGLSISHWVGLRDAGSIAAVLLTCGMAYATLSQVHPSRQFLHDVICGTRLVNWPQPQATSA